MVIKYGGNAMIRRGAQKRGDGAISCCCPLVGIHVVLVHGGGPEINAMLKKIGKESRFVGGLRYTDRETMDVVQMVLAGKVNKSLVQLTGAARRPGHRPVRPGRRDDQGGQSIGKPTWAMWGISPTSTSP